MLRELYTKIQKKKEEGDGLLKKMLLSFSSNPGSQQRAIEGEQLHNTAAQFYNIGNFEKAFELYTSAIEKYPNAGSYYSRGVTAMDLNDYERAIADFTSTIQFDKNYTNAYHNRALCFLELLDSYDLMNETDCQDLIDFARNDLKIAISLGHSGAKRFLDMSYE